MLVTAAHYSFPWEGITAFVADEHLVTMNWLYSNAVGGVRLRVLAEDVEPALPLLEWQQSSHSRSIQSLLLVR